MAEVSGIFTSEVLTGQSSGQILGGARTVPAAYSGRQASISDKNTDSVAESGRSEVRGMWVKSTAT
jgi:hypothetical protein